ncbi:hypothetical protein MOTT12_01841 [Mycobacterium intracellulare subsp. yongonense]|nr:hypothetical protein MOTT12_01841 [Mycobacterium intracellulare subsp. yongonense]ARR82630.1 hypothetical protein MOTT27_01809 [Mycobacterium intracellulare subsp. yongonense]
MVANGMAEIVSLARRHLDLQIPEVRQHDLSVSALKEAYPGVTGIRMNELRATLTRQRVEEMLTDPTQAYNLIRHAMTRLDFGGEPVYLEQDVLAFAVDGRIHVVEIKSFPRIDGRADPTKASATVRQTAVYVLSLQQLMLEIGALPDVVNTTTMIVLPENLTFRPIAETIDIDIHVRRLSRQLASVPQAAEILDAVPAGTRLPAHPARGAGADELAAAAAVARETLAALPSRFTDGCATCPLFHHCRDEAELHRSTARLGSAVAGACGNVTDIAAALALADGRRAPVDASEAAVAATLARGAAAARLAIGRLA